MSRRMTSIASAAGWKARYASGVVTLVSWALVEEADGSTQIVGVVQRSATPESPIGKLQLADEVDGFEGYTFTGLATRTADA